MLSNTVSLWDSSLKIIKIPLLLSLFYFWGILVKDKESCGGGVGHDLDFGGWVGSDVLGDWDKESLNFFWAILNTRPLKPCPKIPQKKKKKTLSKHAREYNFTELLVYYTIFSL